MAQYAPGGTSVQGAVAIHRASFAFNTPGLATGATVTFHDGWTPSVGEVLYDGWISVLTAWDGTTPIGDFGSLSPGPSGILDDIDGFHIDMTTADATNLSGNQNILDNDLSAAPYNVSLLTANTASRNLSSGIRLIPGVFTNTDPMKVVVSQDGTTTGGDPGSTQGAAALYLVTAKPT